MRGKGRGITLLSTKFSGIEVCRVHFGNISQHPEELFLMFIFNETDSCTDTDSEIQILKVWSVL